MNTLDVVIVFIVVAQIMWWAGKGFVRGVPSLLGFWLGVFVGAWLAPYVIGFIGDEPIAQLLFAFAVILAIAFAGEAAGRFVGERLSGLTQKLHLEKLDSVLGAAFAAAMTLVIAWLFASIVSGLPSQTLNRQIRESVVIQSLDNVLPPAPEVLSKLASIVRQADFPQVFAGIEPRPVEPVTPPSSSDVAAALKAAGRSTVRIEGEGCGGVVSGSGFVADSNLVITNAHVVAGITQPLVVDINGRHPAVPVVFDPDLDIAVLRTSGLAGSPLPLAANSYSRGTTAVALGYPNGGPLEADTAGVLRQIEARGRNIYNDGIVTRSVYELQTEIDQGNSGGPVVLPDGTVVGVVFARSVSFDNIGYAVTSTEVSLHLARAKEQQRAVATVACT